ATPVSFVMPTTVAWTLRAPIVRVTGSLFLTPTRSASSSTSTTVCGSVRKRRKAVSSSVDFMLVKERRDFSEKTSTPMSRPAVCESDSIVAAGGGLVGMGGHDHGDAKFPLQFHEQVEDDASGGGVEVAGGFVG